jgi:hypothetical protein
VGRLGAVVGAADGTETGHFDRGYHAAEISKKGVHTKDTKVSRKA